MSKMSACRGAYYFATPKTRQAQSALRKPDDGGVLFSGEALYAGPSAQWSVAHGIPRRPVPMIRTMVGFANLSSRNLSDDVLRNAKNPGNDPARARCTAPCAGCCDGQANLAAPWCRVPHSPERSRTHAATSGYCEADGSIKPLGLKRVTAANASADSGILLPHLKFFFAKHGFHRKATPFWGKPFLDRFLGEGA
jgi:hypothetical protein